ncbi:RGG repeats nuclear RNA binding protein A-like [Trifolium pratense]|uniref:RGG repeats nuclear RNA binding protein A-like n=1 Tax=Trifolium pratense TaxID=57577 RepID=UPI001E6973A0|nr:RGG repeats nuclear RNA binding protein A-like [Trifolium pratense]
MATINPFDLLDDDAEDPSLLIAAELLKAAAAPVKKPADKEQGGGKQRGGAQTKPAQLPSKPTPPAQAVRESRNEGGRGGRGFSGRGGGRGFGGGRGGRGFGRDYSNGENSFPGSGALENHGPIEEGDKFSERRNYGGPRPPYRGGRRGGFSNGEAGEEGRPRRTFERHSGTGRGNEFKREGAGRGNWGTETDEIAQVTEEAVIEGEKNIGDEKPAVENDAAEGNKDIAANEAEEKEAEDKEMTLEEYQKVLEEKRKALQVVKTEERKVDTKEFETMQALSCKKDNFEIFAKLGSDKDKRKEAFDKEEKAKKSVSINEFLKPAEGDAYYRGRGGRGREARGGGGGYRGGNLNRNVRAPSIEDPGHFPTLGAK